MQAGKLSDKPGSEKAMRKDNNHTRWLSQLRTDVNVALYCTYIRKKNNTTLCHNFNIDIQKFSRIHI